MVELVNVCEGIELVPFAITPVIPVGCVADQVNTAPATLLKVTIAEVAPEHIVCGIGEKVTTGEGLTVMTTVNVAPRQLPNFGVMV